MNPVVGAGLFVLAAAIIGLVGYLIGVWWTNEHSDRIEDRRAENDRKRDEEARRHAQREKRQKEEAIRQQLFAEVAFNQQLLEDLNKRVFFQLAGFSDDMQLTKRIRFLREKLPSWQRVIWEGQAAQLPLMLGDSTERVNAFYSQLQDLQGYHETMTANMPPHLVYDYDAWWKDYQGGMVAGGTPLENSSFKAKALDFLTRTNETWYKCEGVLNTLDKQPNPAPERLLERKD
jgi:hypothetical protein